MSEPVPLRLAVNGATSPARLPFSERAYWAGSAEIRRQVYRDEPSDHNARMLARAEAIERAVAGGRRPDEIPEFSEWQRAPR